jgi:hypothetical protein
MQIRLTRSLFCSRSIPIEAFNPCRHRRAVLRAPSSSKRPCCKRSRVAMRRRRAAWRRSGLLRCGWSKTRSRRSLGRRWKRRGCQERAERLGRVLQRVACWTTWSAPPCPWLPPLVHPPRGPRAARCSRRGHLRRRIRVRRRAAERRLRHRPPSGPRDRCSSGWSARRPRGR